MSTPELRERVLPRLIEDEMRESFIDYSMSVIVQRALPDVRDGLKPVHRRILYAMHEAGLAPNRAVQEERDAWWATCWASTTRTATLRSTTRSCAWCRTSRCATRWSTGRATSARIDGDSAAAYRYTEARLTPLATETAGRHRQGHRRLRAQLRRPAARSRAVLPARFPNLLVNGCSGIAVGMATNIPPHNLREVVDGLHAPDRQPRRRRSTS